MHSSNIWAMVAAIFETLIAILIILIFFTGIGLLIPGLIRRKKGLWITGTVILSVSFVLFILGLLFYIGETRKSNSYDDYYEYAEDSQVSVENPVQHDVYSPKTDSILKQKFSEAVSGSIQDESGNPCRLEVFPDKYMPERGIQIIEFSDVTMDDGKKGIRIECKFSKKFNGKFMLEIFGIDDNELDNIVIHANESAGSSKSMNFVFHKVIYPSDMQYCTLTAFE